jgi:hypothetical protein
MKLETIFYMPLALLVQYPAASPLFFISAQRREPFFPMRWSSRTAALPLSFWIIPFKPNFFSKKNNSKIFSETFFFTELSLSLYLIILTESSVQK